MKSSKISSDILQIYNCAINSVSGINIIRNRISVASSQLHVRDLNERRFSYDLNSTQVFIVGAGKAVLGLCEAFLSVVDDYNKQTANEYRIDVKCGILNVPHGLNVTNESLLDKYKVKLNFAAKNNLPDNDAVTATSSIVELLKTIKDQSKNGLRSLIVSFISGGGSALLSYPKPTLSIHEKSEFISKLSKSGCDIIEMNAVRRCLSLVKGGKLAKMAVSDTESVQMLNLIASDVIGDSLSVIASGPTAIDRCPNPSAVALNILNKYKINVSDKIRRLIETEEAIDGELSSVRNVLLVNNSIAVEAAQKKAYSLGYKVIDMGTRITGEASQVGKTFASIANMDSDEFKNDSKIAWIGGGETTVTISPEISGVGGRCQELALAFFIQTYGRNENIAFLAAGTDGQDGPTPVAGCLLNSIDNHSKQEAEQALLEHNSYCFWKKCFPDALLNTNGPTGVNVMDIYCVIKFR